MKCVLDLTSNNFSFSHSSRKQKCVHSNGKCPVLPRCFRYRVVVTKSVETKGGNLRRGRSPPEGGAAAPGRGGHLGHVFRGQVLDQGCFRFRVVVTKSVETLKGRGHLGHVFRGQGPVPDNFCTLFLVKSFTGDKGGFFFQAYHGRRSLETGDSSRTPQPSWALGRASAVRCRPR